MTPEEKSDAAQQIDRAMMSLARLKAHILGYARPVCANTDLHPHGPAGNCLSLP